MKLFLMRHAHAEQSKEKQDIERKLTTVGEAEAVQAGSFLMSYIIDKLIVSHVKRAEQTADIIQKEVPISKIQTVQELYEGNHTRLMQVLLDQEDSAQNILLIGHNPAIYDIAIELANHNCKNFDFLSASSMPTARIVILDFWFMNSWKELRKHAANIVEIFTPSI